MVQQTHRHYDTRTPARSKFMCDGATIETTIVMRCARNSILLLGGDPLDSDSCSRARACVALIPSVRLLITDLIVNAHVHVHVFGNCSVSQINANDHDLIVRTGAVFGAASLSPSSPVFNARFCLPFLSVVCRLSHLISSVLLCEVAGLLHSGVHVWAPRLTSSWFTVRRR